MTGGDFFPEEMFGNHLEISHEIWMNKIVSKIYHCYCMAILFMFLNVHGFQNIKTYFKILGGKSGHCSRPLRGFRLVELVQCAALLKYSIYTIFQQDINSNIFEFLRI